MNTTLTQVASDVMSSPVKTLPVACPLTDAIQLFTDEGITGAAVVGEDGVPCGVLSMADVVLHVSGFQAPVGVGFEAYAYPGDSPIHWQNVIHRDFADDLDQVTVGDVMTDGVLTTTPDASLAAVAREMTENKVHRLFVMEDGTLTGVVSTMDLIAAIAEG
jgi:CBS domain-containing protein